MVLAVLILVPAGAVTAGVIFDGETVRVDYLFPNTSTVHDTATVVVGPGVELSSWPMGQNWLDIDIADTNILITHLIDQSYNPGAFNGPLFADALASIPSVNSVTINPATDMPGFDISRVTFDDDNIWVNFESLSFVQGNVVSLDVEADIIPEPATLSLLALGGLGPLARRRRKR